MRADAGDDRLWSGPPECVGCRAGGELDGQRIDIGRAIGVIDLQQPQLRGSFADRDLLDDPHLADAARLGSKPAAGAQIVRQNLALQLSALVILQEGGQVGLGFERRHDPLFRRRVSRPATGRKTNSDRAVQRSGRRALF